MGSKISNLLPVMDKEGRILKEGKVMNEEDEVVLFFSEFKTPAKGERGQIFF